MAWDGVEQFRASLTTLAAQVDAAVLEAVAKAAATVVKEAQANFEGSHKAGLPHTPPNSSGGYPNRVTGNMARSITAEPIVRYGSAVYETSVGPRAVQSRAVELGLRNAPSIHYPFFVPGAQRAGKEFPRLMQESLEKYLS